MGDGTALDTSTKHDADVVHEVTSEAKSRHEAAIHSLSAAIDDDKSFPTAMPWMHYVKLLPTPSDKRAAALALLEILRPHIILTRSLYKRTVPGQKAPRDRLRRRLRLLGKHKDHIVEYEKQIKASDETPGTDAEEEKAEPRKSFTNFVERSLANDEYMAKGWFRRVAPRLPPDEQTRLFRETTAILLAKAREYETRGSAKSLQKRTITALLHDIDQSYRQLRILGHASIDTATLRRPFNPFTRASHSTLRQEIQEMERWRAAQSSFYNETLEDLKPTTKLDGMSKHILEKQNKVTSLKLLFSGDYLERLRAENTSVLSIEPETDTIGQQLGSSPEFTRARGASKPVMVMVPYQVQHHILGDVHERFKRAIFVFGRRYFPDVMQEKNLNDPEGLSIWDFEKLLSEDEHWRHLYKIIQRRLESLRFIRNAYAHEFTEVNLDRLEELLADAQSIAWLVEDSSLVILTQKYRDLLTVYGKRYLDECAGPRQLAAQRYSAANKQLKIAKTRLYHSCTSTHTKRYRAEKSRIERIHQESKAAARAEYVQFELNLASELKAFALGSSIRYRLGLGDSSWAASLVKTLYEEYATTHDSPTTESTADVTKHAENMHTPTTVSGTSTPSPRSSTANDDSPARSAKMNAQWPHKKPVRTLGHRHRWLGITR
ncbi:uncharacterized protein J4E79_009032 [Alternaria viburni]|uniref:uncharacterized protein n=1 Tax=Alternaria viburni TaxID=566460 RepID=UPI0020C29493|nr:uncharacterized protein J4E79_009032 [Alternaria viburni]KAI4651552.1 hypothetical protein J4E79_009032 [Alternaria viburni]